MIPIPVPVSVPVPVPDPNTLRPEDITEPESITEQAVRRRMQWLGIEWLLRIACIVFTQLVLGAAAVYLVQDGFRRLVHSQDTNQAEISTFVIGLGITYITTADPLSMGKERTRLVRCRHRLKRLLDHTFARYDNRVTEYLAKEVEAVVDYSCSVDNGSPGWYDSDKEKEV